MEDIQHKKDIQYLVETFYRKALADPQIGPVFEAADFRLEKHIPVMVSFWETILFDVITYKGNPMLKHLELNKSVALKTLDFERWIEIWTETVNHKFSGKLAEKAIVRAKAIAQLMEYKIKEADHKIGL